MTDPVAQFIASIEGAGLPAPSDLIADGLLHRFSTNEKNSDDSGWYVLHVDGVPAGAFGCWRTGVTSTWCARTHSDLSA